MQHRFPRIRKSFTRSLDVQLYNPENYSLKFFIINLSLFGKLSCNPSMNCMREF